IQSVQETAHVLEASIQIPAERLGLIGDMDIKVSSRKQASGEINPDYCHVLFYLELEHLNEMVIEMRIQKRKVCLTISNEHHLALKKGHDDSIEMLKEGLRELDYDLQTVQFQDYYSRHNQETTKKNPYYHIHHEGVDYRI